MIKHIIFTLIVVATMTFAWFVQADPAQSLDATMAQVNGGSQEATNLMVDRITRSMMSLASLLVILCTIALFYGNAIINKLIKS